jgi:hypothetical protein
MIADRIRASIWAMLKAIDILLCTIWLAPLYICNLADKPSGRQMISSYVGQADFYGTRWGRRAAAFIDWGAKLLGDEPDHCRRAFLAYRDLDD